MYYVKSLNRIKEKGEREKLGPVFPWSKRLPFLGPLYLAPLKTHFWLHKKNGVLFGGQVTFGVGVSVIIAISSAPRAHLTSTIREAVPGGWVNMAQETLAGRATKP